MPTLSAAAIYLIACHGGPADHFATFAEKLIEKGHKVQVYAAGPALKKFQDRKIQVAMSFNADGLSKEDETKLATQIAKSCSVASVVLTDVGHAFDIALQNALAIEAPTALCAAFYDNPEPYVPGGYSKIAAQVMMIAKKVLFANANLAESPLYQEPNREIPLPKQNRVGLGYYPVGQAEKIAARRQQDRDTMRKELFSSNKLEDKGQKVLVYFGGNNEEYFAKAFPAFLRLLSESTTLLSNVVIVMQQHPGAKKENIDRQQLETWINEQSKVASIPKIIISEKPSDDMQVIADKALYYQTSMGPLFALAGIPTVQVGHEPYEDVLVKGGITPSVTTSSSFVKAITARKPTTVSKKQQKAIFKSLGIREDWYKTLEQTLPVPQA